ncbi:phage tail protein [Marinomonas ostreistagni]|uniref:Uncharacterized protein n=1 Tax=Marinomonas ostreistagni TaxID=359209 RepID=A0ABS0ZAR8_9GAMM|nr:phage tail protein [Marinomonas ostreistagni]MBJ7550737.1 hypothetical protein [Marinomonas ostreistagni]
MANFPGLQMTAAGRDLQAKAQTGVKLDFSRVGLGDGEMPADIDPLTAMVSEKKSLDITDFELLGDGTSQLEVLLTNENLVEGFFIREIGVFAIDPDTETEILYSYANAEAYSDYLPAFGAATIVEMKFNLITVIGNATNVTATIYDYLVHATKADVDELRPYILPPGGVVGQLVRKASNEEGDYELFDATEGVQFRINSVTEQRVAVANQTIFALTKTITNGLAVYVNGLRIPDDEWSPVGGSNMQFNAPLNEGDKVQFVNNEEVGTVSLARVSLDGPDLVYVGTSNNYTITDYDAFSNYAVSASVGTATVSGNVITLDIPSEASTDDGVILTVERNDGSNSFQIAMGAQVVAKPQITSPQNLAIDVAENPSLAASSFTTYPANADTHQDTDYQIATDADFTNVVWESLNNSSSLVGINVPKGFLQISTTYYVRIRYRGVLLGVSAWSDSISLTTKDSFYYLPNGTVLSLRTITGASGLEEMAWLSSDLFIAADANNGMKFFSSTGQYLDVASVPASYACCFDGEFVYTCTTSGMVRKYTVSGYSLTLVDSVDLNISGTTIYSIEVINGDIAVLSLNEYKIRVYQGFSSNLRFSLSTPFTAHSGGGGIAWDGKNLFSCAAGFGTIYVHNGLGESIQRTFSSGHTQGVIGVCFDGQNLWSLGRSDDKFAKYGTD